MYLLAVDTATNCGGVSLGRNGELIGMVMLKTPLRYSEKILYYVDFLLRQHDLDITQIDCFVATTGPGSFTGLRVGLATVKAFCHSLHKPAIGISTLEALAYRFRTVHDRIAPMIDARRQQIYGAIYQIANSDVHTVREAEVASPAAWLQTLPKEPLVFVGDGAQLYKHTIQAIHPEGRRLDTDNRLLEALCQLAYLRVIQGKTVSADGLLANYVRPSDAELKQKM